MYELWSKNWRLFWSTMREYLSSTGTMILFLQSGSHHSTSCSETKNNSSKRLDDHWFRHICSWCELWCSISHYTHREKILSPCRNFSKHTLLTFLYYTMKETCTLRDGSEHGRIILGAWQLSEWHSQRQEKDETLLAYLQNGIDTIDCADIYTGVEQAIGKVITQLQTLITPPLPRVHTKHVPDLDTIRSWNISPETTRSLIDTSIARIRKNCLDLVQFHHCRLLLFAWGHWYN